MRFLFLSALRNDPHYSLWCCKGTADLKILGLSFYLFYSHLNHILSGHDVLLFFYDTESVEFLKEIREKVFREVERALAFELFKGSRVDVAESEIKLVLTGEADGSQVNTLGKDLAELDVHVFQGALLSRLHWVTVTSIPSPRCCVYFFTSATFT